MSGWIQATMQPNTISVDFYESFKFGNDICVTFEMSRQAGSTIIWVNYLKQENKLYQNSYHIAEFVALLYTALNIPWFNRNFFEQIFLGPQTMNVFGTKVIVWIRFVYYSITHSCKKERMCFVRLRTFKRNYLSLTIIFFLFERNLTCESANFVLGGIILAKGWLDHSHTFWTMANYTYQTSTKFADSHVISKNRSNQTKDT